MANVKIGIYINSKDIFRRDKERTAIIKPIDMNMSRRSNFNFRLFSMGSQNQCN